MPHIVDDDDALMKDDEDFDESLDDDDDSASEDAESEASDKADKSEPSSDEESDDEPYGKRVQKRISKLTGKMRELERETSFWKEKVTALENKTNAKEFAEYQNQVEWTAHEINRQIEQARVAKKAAIEEGDVDKQIKLDEQMLDLREQLAEKKRMATAAKEQAAQFQEATDKQKSQVQSTPTIPDHLPTGTKQWLRSNAWFIKNDDPKAVEFARMLDASLQDEGYSPDDPAMYTELDKRLHAIVPRLAKQAKTPPKPRVAGSSTDGQRQDSAASVGKPQRKLTSDDLAKMKRYGFDPGKAEHRKHWLRRFDQL
jgi:hypothetical protein